MGYKAGRASRLWSARHPCCSPCLCHHTRPPWAAGPMAGRFSCPGLSWSSGVAAAGSQAIGSWEQLLYQGKALAVEGRTSRGVGGNSRTRGHLCDPTSPRAEKKRTQVHPVPRGGFHKAGEGPAFGDSFPDFSSLRNRAQRSVPTRLAGRFPETWYRSIPQSPSVTAPFTQGSL